jgi:uncharacterized protein (DUF305 family)
MRNPAFAALAIVGLLIFSVAAEQGSQQHSCPSMHEGARQPTSAFAEAMAEATDRMHREMAAASRTGDPDRDFLAMMIPHHGGAVEMARLILINGRDPLVRQLAEEIIASQQAEIAAMRARLGVLQRGPDPLPGGFPAISGTRGQ